jgi:P-type Ca2+ transporter type 2C
MAKSIAEIAALTQAEAFKELGSSRRGLTAQAAARNMQEYGPNVLVELKKKPIFYRFVAQFTSLFAIILEIAVVIAIVSWLVSKDPYQMYVAIAVAGVVFLNATIGFFQEYRAEKATEALQKMVPKFSRVVRDGERMNIPAEDIVPGDLLVLEEGDNIVADARVVEEFELRTNNMTLTGESDPVKITSEPIKSEGLSKTDIRNLIFMGTSVATGTCTAIVLDTGMNTEFGNVFKLTTAAEEPLSPLEIQVASLAKRVATLAIIVGFSCTGWR